ncbi:hypothetical protein [Microbacterium sp. NPDC055683]
MTTALTRRDIVSRIDHFLDHAEVPRDPQGERDRLTLEAVPLARTLLERGWEPDHAAREGALAVIRALELPSAVTRLNHLRSEIAHARSAS